jgi:predicted nucleic acid-binding protein
MSKIIIDTNIYLNFYRLDSGQSLEMLKNLNQLIKNKNFKLVLPKQIEDEFIRNKNSKSAIYGDHILNFEKGLSVQFKIPHLIKSSQKIKQIEKTIKKLQSQKEDAVKDYKNRVFNPNSKINQQIDLLFSNAIRPPETNEVLQKAWFRNLRGNPPRKDNSSFGDAIIWESILEQCTDDDLILISGDGDFESEINQEDIHEFLKTEWSKKTDKKIMLYTKLGSFINQQSTNKKKPIKEETIQEEGRLNSVFATPSAALEFNTGEYGNIFYGDKPRSMLNDYSSITAYKNKCVCCGAEIDQLSAVGSGYSILGLSRCENCRNQLSPGLTCSKCGRHFHRDALSIYMNDGKCDDCQNKP